jgi:hypothetical protein
MTQQQEHLPFHKKNKKELKIVAIVLGVILLTASTLLISKYVATVSDEKSGKQSQKTTDTPKVFDSTDEEKKEVKKDTEKAKVETAQKTEEAKQELKNQEPQNDYKLSKSFETITSNNCNLNILYTDKSKEPFLYKGALLLNRDNTDDSVNSAVVFCQSKSDIESLKTGISSIEKNEIKDYFTPDSFGRIDYVAVSNNPNYADNGSVSYVIIYDKELSLSIQMKKDSKLLYNKIQLPIAESKKIITTESYTNPYFTDFKLVYPSDWKFSNTTTNSPYPELLSRKLTLTKQDVSLDITLSPKIVTGCGPIVEPKSKAYDIPGDIDEYSGTIYSDIKGIIYTYYGKNGDCAVLSNTINTNISKAAYGDFYDKLYNQANYNVFPDDKNVIYNAKIDLNIRTHSPELRDEVRKIIENSTFK